MPLISSADEPIENLLRDLSFVIPDFSTANIDVKELMTLDQTNLPRSFQETLLMSSFFKLLQVEIQRRYSRKQHEQDDYESDRLGSLRSGDRKYTEAALKEEVHRDPIWRRFRDEVGSLKAQIASVDAMVGLLDKKGIALNVLTARTRAEISAGLQTD